MNYVLGGLFVFFALSLFGMYEIELPSGLARFTSAREGKGGLVGTMFMALTFTIISFACVAPFLGGFGGTAAGARPLLAQPARRPGVLRRPSRRRSSCWPCSRRLLKKLPKSGSWLNSVKVVMGFLELAAAFKFFRRREFASNRRRPIAVHLRFRPRHLDRPGVLCGLYLLGLFRLPHDTPAESIGVPRLLFSAAFLGLGLYLTPALFKVGNEGASQRPGGSVYAWVDSFLLPEPRGHNIGDLHYAVQQARDHLRKTGTPKRIFVDFTGVVCSNCRYNEQHVFPIPEVRRAMQEYIGVELYTDNVPLDLFAPTLSAELGTQANTMSYARANAAFELKVFDQEALPFYAILEPQADGRILIVDEYNEGRIMNVPEFTRFVTGARAQQRVQLAAAALKRGAASWSTT